MNNNTILISFENLSISIENKQNKIDNNSKYIFVRLYNTKYKNAGVGTNFLDFGQKITASSKWKVISNHAAISMNLQARRGRLSPYGRLIPKMTAMSMWKLTAAMTL